MVVGQAPRDQVRRDLVAHAHVQVKALGRHVHQPVEHLQPHLQTRVLAHQARQRRRHHVAAKAEAAGDAQQATRLAARDRYLLQQLIHVVQDALRPVEHALALVGDHYAARGAVQERYAQFLLQQADALADIGGRGSQLLRGGGKAGLAHHGAEHAQIVGGWYFLHDV